MTFDHQLWLSRIDDSQGLIEKVRSRWERSRKLYNMKYWEERGYQAETYDRITPVNYTTTFIATMLAATFARNPKMFIRARRPRFDRFASKMDEVVEQMDDEQNVKEVYLEILLDAYLCNIGWAEAGWIPDSPKEMPQPEPGGVTEQKKLFERIGDFLKGGDASSEPESTPPLVQTGILHEGKEAGQFFLIRRSPYDVLWPMGFHRYYEIPYLILHERLMLEDFLANPTYKEKDRINIDRRESPGQVNTGKLTGPKHISPSVSSSNGSPPSDNQVVHLYTIWDRRSQTVTTISKDCTLPHRGPDDWPYFSEGFPLIPLQMNVVPDTPEDESVYGFSDVEPITPQVIEKSNIRTDMVDHRRRSHFQVFVQKGSTTEDELKNQQGQGVMNIIPVTNIEAIKMSPAVSLPPALYETESAIESDLGRESGLQLLLADSQRAASFNRATVATIAQGNANLKTNFKVDRLEAFLKSVAHYRVGLFWQYMTREQVGDLTGEMPDPDEWPDLPTDSVIARKRVRRELELKITPGSTRPIQDDVLDREQFIRFIQTFQAVSPDRFKRVETNVLAILAKKFRESELEVLIKQATDSKEEEVAQQENQLLLQGHPQVVQGDHASHIAVHAKMLQDPQVKGMVQQAVQGGQRHPFDVHFLGHVEEQKSQQAGEKQQRRNKQSVHQQVASPSGREVARKGTPSHSDLSGQAMNLRSGTGPVKVPNL